MYMCGRFTLTAPATELEKKLGIALPQNLPARSNISPSQQVLVIPDFDPQTVIEMEWGLRPVWWKEKGRSLINIRTETLKEKKTFARLLKGQRCVLLADGFYEWDKHEKPSQPYLFRFKTHEVFAFAGLWDKEEEGYACALITTEANELVRKVHDRMPVILPVDKMKEWLDHETPQSALLDLLKPYPAKEMEMLKIESNLHYFLKSPRIDS